MFLQLSDSWGWRERLNAHFLQPWPRGLAVETGRPGQKLEEEVVHTQRQLPLLFRVHHRYYQVSKLWPSRFQFGKTTFLSGLCYAILKRSYCVIHILIQSGSRQTKSPEGSFLWRTSGWGRCQALVEVGSSTASSYTHQSTKSSKHAKQTQKAK